MKPNLEDFYQQLNIANRESFEAIESSFSELSAYLSGLDPIKLLSQLSLTYLFVQEDKFINESDDTLKWARWIEFLAGFLVSKNYPENPEKHIDGENLEKVENILDEYFNSVNSYMITSNSVRDSKYAKTEMIVHAAKIHSLYVRGDTYPHKFLTLAEELYSDHDQWFSDKLGFTIEEAIAISQSIIHEYNNRANDAKDTSIKKAKDHINKLVRNGKIDERDSNKFKTNTAAYFYFGNSDSLLSFTLDDLMSFSGFSKETCEHYIERLSQHFGYKNPKFLEVFQDPHAAPWDYNSLYEKPIISYKDKLFVPIPSLFPTVLFNTFHYDLITDSAYANAYNQSRGAWLEKKTAKCFKKLFPNNEVWTNPKYPNGDELADVIVLHDRKIFIVQCKSKRLRYESVIGKSFETIKDDVEKGIKESFEQAVRARDYISSKEKPEIKIDDNRILVVDRDQISDIFLMSTTLGSYQNLTTRLANINPALNLFTDNQYPWAISLFDLEIVSELIDYPSMFIHYAKRRLLVEQTNFELMADEVDLLGFYFEQGLSFNSDEYKKPTCVSLSGFSSAIDEYMFKKYELGENPQKPKQKMPDGFEDYLANMERLGSAYKTDCALRLLDFNYQGRELFLNAIEQSKEKTKKDGGLNSFSTGINEVSCGFSFISMDAESDIDKLFRQTVSFAVMKKHATKFKEWVGFGWDKNSREKIDIAVFLSYNWSNDPVLDKLANEYLKKGKLA